MHHGDHCVHARRGWSMLLHGVGVSSLPSRLGWLSQGTSLALAPALLASFIRAARQAQMGHVATNWPSAKIRFSIPFLFPGHFKSGRNFKSS
jgi:hypothetical protein